MKNLKYLKPEAVKLLVVHCSGNRCDHELTVEGLIATGNARFGQPSYHYYVRRNGAVVPILPESVQGIHAKNYNHCSLGICYEGGLNAKGVAEDTRTVVCFLRILPVWGRLLDFPLPIIPTRWLLVVWRRCRSRHG